MSSEIHSSKMNYILATDIGSTTTKARLFKKLEEGWRYIVSGEAPTTVEEPYEDVTLGVRNAVREIEELTGHKILSATGNEIIVPNIGDIGVDLYITTSSAGGGLQMMVAGIIRIITAESANRAALGAGAIVMDIIAVDDHREDYEKIKRIRSLRPDMILIAGGTDGGADTHIVGISELIRAADPKCRLGDVYKLPIVFAGNIEARSQIKDIFKDKYLLSIVDNIRPTLEIEQIEPARRAIHEFFMEHVMSHAPGYLKLMKWTNIGIMPTPAAEGLAMQLIASTYKMNVIGVGLGGATTNIYSVVDGRFVRSVSANLGMSYSVCNVMKEAGISNIMRWLPFDLNENSVRCRLMNKMIRPTTIPQTLEELIIEHAIAREALRLGLKHHKTIATRLKGTIPQRTVDDYFDQALEDSYIKMQIIDIIAGTGGLLSHAPRRIQSMFILTDAFQPEGVTTIFQDSVFMMPHLGVLSTVNREIAWNIFDKDCLVELGTVIAPAGRSNLGDPVMNVELKMPNEQTIFEEMKFGEIKLIKLEKGKKAECIISPFKGFDAGEGSGHKVKKQIIGGVAGVLLDARGRPLSLPEDSKLRKELLTKWFKAIDIYPEDNLKEII
jgi:uncharacterized protein (TIGR01319 family)